MPAQRRERRRRAPGAGERAPEPRAPLPRPRCAAARCDSEHFPGDNPETQDLFLHAIFREFPRILFLQISVILCNSRLYFVNVDLGEIIPTSIYLLNLASIQPRISPVKILTVTV